MNRNTFYATTFVDELARAGLHHVCAAPGSRHTPLMLAFAKDERIKVWPHLDERSASFFALGLARALDEPVALICTSGTAGANMYPAIIEAHQSRIPLLVITADRPPELRHSGANQTIDQIKMFGDFVLWFVDAALPESNPPAVAIRNLRTLADRALAKANGLRKGVVHINMPFRKPLEPIEIEGDIFEIPEDILLEHAQTNIFDGRLEVDGLDILSGLGFVVKENENGVIICGGNMGHHHFYHLTQATQKIGYPVLAESSSMVRHVEKQNGLTLGGYDAFLPFSLKPDVIIRFGDVPISNTLNQFVANSNAKYIIHISEDGEWADDTHLITHQYQTKLFRAFGFLTYPRINIETGEHLELDRRNSALATQYAALEAATWDVIDREIANGAYFDGGVVYDVVDLIPDGSTLFAGNSLPVRHLDQFGKPQNKRIYTYANRGASGIDGNISTALGAGAARPDAPLVAILGDITFYHDMNGLLAVHRCGVPVTIVLLNNDGGGIFHRLPINQFEPEFTEWFVTPHGLDYSHAAKMYGLEWVSVQGRDEFRQAFSESVNGRTSTIIEFRSDAKADLARRNEIVAAVHKELARLKI